MFISDAASRARVVPGPSAGGWAALSACYRASFAACGFRVRDAALPEIYAPEPAFAVLGIEAGDWHLAVKPIEHLRPFHGLPNGFVCDWPFPELSSSTLGGSPFFDQVHQLGQAAIVLCTTEFTTTTLRRAGVAHAMTLPPAIPPPAQARPASERDGRRFRCVVESVAMARHLGPTLDGFIAAAAQHPGLHLTLRLRGGETRAALDRHTEVARGTGCLTIRLDAENGDDAQDGQDGDDQAGFFLSAHPAPGLQIPLVEAMQAGMVPVATRVAGTGSVLPADAAVAIEAHPDLLDGQGEPIGRFMPLTSHPPSAEAVRDAVLQAATLDPAARTRMAGAARAAAVDRFGLDRFRRRLGQLDAGLSEVPRR